tara:strand:- start:184 stop:510 length:327 start_codon:yes stop_codon:yes gene_type:complete
MAITIDTRPTVFGDRLIVTGTYEAGDVEIDLGDYLANIDAFMVMPKEAFTASVEQIANIDGGGSTATNLITNFMEFGIRNGDTGIFIEVPLKSQTTKGGTFLAIGRRS